MFDSNAFVTGFECVYPLQVSLRDPLRSGVDDHELGEIINAAVSILLSSYDAISCRQLIIG